MVRSIWVIQFDINPNHLKETQNLFFSLLFLFFLSNQIESKIKKGIYLITELKDTVDVSPRLRENTATVWLHVSDSQIHFPSTIREFQLGCSRGIWAPLKLGEPSPFPWRYFDRPSLVVIKTKPNPNLLGLVNSSAQGTTQIWGTGELL